ncbi:MAG TPA: chemotaxis response regulator protein-glutamate methylesterase [Alphaproteobacteria bacterium]
MELPLSPVQDHAKPVRVMIVDDSAIIRTIIEKFLKGDTQIEVVGFAGNGQDALTIIENCQPDVIILDIEMPVMDGLTALPLLLKKKRDVKIVICSTLSQRGAEISLKALSLGAADYILKPTGAGNIQQSTDFQNNLRHIIHSLGRRRVIVHTPAQPVTLRKAPLGVFTPDILAIGSSTGGPNALIEFFKALKSAPIPVVITQHMPKTFTTVLAGYIEQNTGFICHEGQHNMLLQPGHIYLAPGGYHMRFKRTEQGVAVQLDEGPMENFCRPAVDPMLRSLADIYGRNILTVILTGMGNDGLQGCQTIVKSGGCVIAQDEPTSIVWGMPGAVAKDGLCTLIQPISKLAEFVTQSCLNTKTAS